jgi:hypothetical protein
VVRQLLVISALMIMAAAATAQPKVSGGVTGGNPGGSTAPASGTTQTQSPPDTKADPAPANPAASRSDAAKKALRALKGGESAGKGGPTASDRNPSGR